MCTVKKMHWAYNGQNMLQISRIYLSLNIDSKKQKETYGLGRAEDDHETKAALRAYFETGKNTEFEKFKLRNMRQLQSETIDQFAT